VVAAAARRWPDLAQSYVRIVDIPEDRDVFLVGTVYKEMGLKPSILDEYNKKRGDVETRRERFTQAGDQAVLEDEGGRVTLVFATTDHGEGANENENENVGRCVTGSVVGVRGRVRENGDFQVKEMCFAGMADNHGDRMNVDDAV